MNKVVIQIYRVENSDGYGPYTIPIKKQNLEKMTHEHDFDSGNHPTPQTEGFRPRPLSTSLRCGFSSIEQLKDWFSVWLNPLFENGFYICKISIEENDTSILKKQVVFDNNKILKKEKHCDDLI